MRALVCTADPPATAKKYCFKTVSRLITPQGRIVGTFFRYDKGVPGRVRDIEVLETCNAHANMLNPGHTCTDPESVLLIECPSEVNDTVKFSYERPESP